jgi:MoaA/NifB/PqqE/SkfB family radical SAM enzyme
MSSPSAVSLVGSLLFRSLRFRMLRTTGLHASPEALSMEITHRCIARCVMCNIWKIPATVSDLPMHAWIDLLDRPFFRHLKELDITGGEPFLRDDLLELILGICDVKARRLPDLRSVAITSNGFLTERVVSASRAIASFLKEAKLDLVLVFALDGIGDIHSTIRNVSNGWEKLRATIEGIKDVRQESGNVIIGLKTTVLPVNVDELAAIARFAEEQGLFTIISPCIITEGRYDNADLSRQLAFSREDIRKIIDFYQGPSFQWSYHRQALLDLLRTGSLHKPCSAGFNYYFVRSTGEVHPCPLMNKSIGNFTRAPMEELVSSASARHFRKKVGTFAPCSACTEPGLERYALPFEGLEYLKLLISMGKKDFLAFHSHMGLDKYL